MSQLFVKPPSVPRTTRRPATAATLAVLVSLGACTSLPRDVPSAPVPGALRVGQDQQLLDQLAAGRPELRQTHDFARAQCFVQHAFSAAHGNDRSGFVAGALSQAEQIESALRAGQPTPATQTRGRQGRMRNDLWLRAGQLATNTCAAAVAGCLEVQLVRAGHAYQSLGWRHATSYFAVAEDMARQAEAQAAACAPPASSVPKPVTTRQIALRVDVLFRFDRYEPREVLAAGRAQLDEVAGRLKGVDLVAVRVIGHTDPQGKPAYNLKLSLRRADTVRGLLAARGVPDKIITTQGVGSAEPVRHCDVKKLKGEALRECNQPNRRVTIDFDYVELSRTD